MTLNNGLVFANSPDRFFVLDGTMNMNASGGKGAEWNGDAIQIGNDSGILNAHLNVTGDGNVNSQGRFFAPVTFMSDADVNVAAGASLVFNRPVTFNPVNVGIPANFSGSGIISFSDDVIVNEATTLNMTGGIVDVNRIGTANADGILNVANAWNTNVANFVQLSGGVIQGGTMTIGNVDRVTGHGTIASRIINNTGITASGGTLVVQTDANGNDWDGAANNASLHADSDATLELRDVGAPFGFTGVVSTFAGRRVFANGFALDFNPGSSLFLNGSGTYESTSSTDLGGVVASSARSPSTIKVANNSFLTFEPTSSTTLDADLILRNNNINIEAGATFAGTGALVIPKGSHVVMDANSNANVVFVNDGALRPANSEGVLVESTSRTISKGRQAVSLRRFGGPQ